MTASPWTLDRMPRLDGKTIIVTGANSGIGLEAARILAGAGALVILAGRDPKRLADAQARIREANANANAGAGAELRIDTMALDLASLASVRAFAEAFRQRHERLDVLVNNAGVMAIPRRATADGFEMQLGTNHLGHFALTGLLLDRLAGSAPSRVVSVSSFVHHRGRMEFDDLQSERSYGKWRAYSQSKLANLLFAFELDRRLRARGLDVRSVACHPGYANTNLQSVGPQMAGARVSGWFMNLANRVAAQPPEMGALPTVYAAVGEDIEGGDFTGPSGWMELRGAPRKVKASRDAQDEAAARRLWEMSAALTGVDYAALGG